MLRFVAVPLLALLPVARAQGSLAQLQRQFAEEAQALAQKGPTRDQRDQLLARHVAALQRFLGDSKPGDDLWNGSLMLADLQLQGGDRSAAGKTLGRIDPAAAPGLVLLSAAAMAQHLNLKELRDRQVEAALAKDAPLPDRLAMARMLMTVLHEVERGEAVFDKALAAAKDDEQKALIRFHRADTFRDREDLPDNAGFEELEKLAKDLPATYWGSVAADRLRATTLRPGDDAIAFRAKTRDGSDWSLAAQKGKAVVLVFWSGGDRDTPVLAATLGELAARHKERLAIVGICLDRDADTIDRAATAAGITFPVIGEGLGIETDAALRWFVEGPTVHVIDIGGKVEALGLHAGTADGKSQLQEAVKAALE